MLATLVQQLLVTDIIQVNWQHVFLLTTSCHVHSFVLYVPVGPVYTTYTSLALMLDACQSQRAIAHINLLDVRSLSEDYYDTLESIVLLFKLSPACPARQTDAVEVIAMPANCSTMRVKLASAQPAAHTTGSYSTTCMPKL